MKLNIQNSNVNFDYQQTKTPKYYYSAKKPQYFRFESQVAASMANIVKCNKLQKISQHTDYVKQKQILMSPTSILSTQSMLRKKNNSSILLNEQYCQLLNEQNKNLKQQNEFLINKIKIMCEKDKQIKQTLKKQQDQTKYIKLLKNINEELKLQILQLRELLNNKAQVIELKLKQFIKCDQNEYDKIGKEHSQKIYNIKQQESKKIKYFTNQIISQLQNIINQISNFIYNHPSKVIQKQLHIQLSLIKQKVSTMLI